MRSYVVLLQDKDSSTARNLRYASSSRSRRLGEQGSSAGWRISGIAVCGCQHRRALLGSGWWRQESACLGCSQQAIYPGTSYIRLYVHCTLMSIEKCLKSWIEPHGSKWCCLRILFDLQHEDFPGILSIFAAIERCRSFPSL